MSAESRSWHKSSYSNGSGGACVELPERLDAVRDSKNRNVLWLSRYSVAALVTAIKERS